MIPSFDRISINETNSSYTSLTGSSSVLIRGHNTVNVECYVTYDAINLNYSSTNGWSEPDWIEICYLRSGGEEFVLTGHLGEVDYENKTVTTHFSGTVTNVKDGTFYFSVEDSRNEQGGAVYNVSMIDYSDLSIHATSSPITTNGNLTIDYFGNYFNKSFGSRSNTLTISYRYKKVGSSSYIRGWATTTPTIKNSNFEGSITITGLDYATTSYIIEFRAVDAVITVLDSISSAGQPIFDWSDSDFAFNVPVNINGNLNISKDNEIYFDNDPVISYDGSDLYIGQGSYNNEVGTTYICGNKLEFLSNDASYNGFKIAGLNLTGLANAISNTYYLEVEASNEDDTGMIYADIDPSGSAALRGNTLYFRFHCSWGDWALEDSVNPGDITDLELGFIRIKHDGKIKDLDYCMAVTGSSGAVAGLQMKNVVLDDTWLSFTVYLCNMSHRMYTALAVFTIPVTLNLDAYVD